MVPELVEVVVAAAVVAVVVGGVYCGARKVRTAIWGLRKKGAEDPPFWAKTTYLTWIL